MGCSSRINLFLGCLLILTSTCPRLALTDGYVGCLFDIDLCDADEDCFDDNAFGSCQKQLSFDNYRHLLGSDAIKLLEGELARLFDGGYAWKDEYTQCAVQNILYATRHGITHDPGLCSRLLQMTDPEVSPEILSDLQDMNPNELAIIKYTPFQDDSDSFIYAKEEFLPPQEDSASEKSLEMRTPPNQLRTKKFTTEFHSESTAPTPNADSEALLRRLLEITRDTEKMLENRGDISSRFPSDEVPVFSTDLSSDMSHRPAYTEGGIDWIPLDGDDEEGVERIVSNKRYYPMSIVSKKADGTVEEQTNEPQTNEPPVTQKIIKSDHGDHNNLENSEEEDDDEKAHFIRQMISAKEKSIDENDDDIVDSDDENDGPKVRYNWRHIDPGSDDLTNYGFKAKSRVPTRKSNINIERREESDYLEDSLHAVLPTNVGEEDHSNIFQRPMRYDTKKPGPTYMYHDDEDGISYEDYENAPLLSSKYNSANSQMAREGDDNRNLLSKMMESTQRDKMRDLLSNRDRFYKFAPSEDIQNEERINDLIQMEQMSTPLKKSPHEKYISEASEESELSVKRTIIKSQPEVIENAPSWAQQSKSDNKGNQKEDLVSIDSTRVNVKLKEDMKPGDDEKFVRIVEKFLSLPNPTFSDIRLKDPHQVTFKVERNPQGLNASDVATKIEDNWSKIKSLTQKTVVSAGIGDTEQYRVSTKEQDKKLYILTFVLCGSVVGVVIAVAVAYVVQRHARSKKKLQNITKPDTEASQDYQDLCRQRMATKTTESTERCVSEHASFSPKKIRNMSQTEGQASFSSHSSTSSWNEEPVTSNMDISTGHMILSYMEDHLKNKDRLDREWEALCAYEAEPCVTAAAILPQNVKKNRYPDVLPYDHSRVTLNEETNVSSSDYINASSITDHDPRNPAYIATQGPLPHTAADFWQMIWEQGSVVMVMLTRLMENGVAMCHRHWPEEGSEVYHIYEVHLVSEHIWCDDYLVRSFYLKNLKTGETRTVTQFHFLSWPDNGVPNSTKALLEFRRKVNKSYRGRSCPIVVHCSDGIGRTGTYILIDMVLNRMAKGAKEIDIAATLEHVRDQRGGMVKTKAQFEFVLMAIAEEVHAILRALSQ